VPHRDPLIKTRKHDRTITAAIKTLIRFRDELTPQDVRALESLLETIWSEAA